MHWQCLCWGFVSCCWTSGLVFCHHYFFCWGRGEGRGWGWREEELSYLQTCYFQYQLHMGCIGCIHLPMDNYWKPKTYLWLEHQLLPPWMFLHQRQCQRNALTMFVLGFCFLLLALWSGVLSSLFFFCCDCWHWGIWIFFIPWWPSFLCILMNLSLRVSDLMNVFFPWQMIPEKKRQKSYHFIEMITFRVGCGVGVWCGLSCEGGVGGVGLRGGGGEKMKHHIYSLVISNINCIWVA